MNKRQTVQTGRRTARQPDRHRTDKERQMYLRTDTQGADKKSDRQKGKQRDQQKDWQIKRQIHCR